MALNLDGSDAYIDHGSATNLDDVVPISVLAWIRATEFTTTRGIVTKHTSTTARWHLRYSTVGNFVFIRAYGTTDATSTTTGGPLASGVWTFVAATFDGTNAPKIYCGTRTTLVTECSYSTQQAPVGTLNSEGFAVLRAGLQSASTTANCLIGDVAWLGIWNVVLSLSQIQQQQYTMATTSGCVLNCMYGWDGTGTQQDRSGSGNPGTVTGGTVADHLPLSCGFGAPSCAGAVPLPLPEPILIGQDSGAVRASSSLLAQRRESARHRAVTTRIWR